MSERVQGISDWITEEVYATDFVSNLPPQSPSIIPTLMHNFLRSSTHLLSEVEKSPIRWGRWR